MGILLIQNWVNLLLASGIFFTAGVLAEVLTKKTWEEREDLRSLPKDLMLRFLFLSFFSVGVFLDFPQELLITVLVTCIISFLLGMFAYSRKELTCKPRCTI
ncbi:hypothetical protein ACFL22_00380 [Patescibacteria group bacterium]